MTTIITLIGADARFSASIAQLLKLKTKGHFALGEDGDITLVDADSIEGKKFVEQNIGDHTIILTVTPSQFNHNLIIRKPIKIEELLTTLDKIDAKPTKLTAEIVTDTEAYKAAISVGNPFAKFMNPEYLQKQKQRKFLGNKEQAEIIIESNEPIVNAAGDQLLGEESTFGYWKDQLAKIKKISSYTYNDEFFDKIEKSQLIELTNVYFQTEAIYYDMSKKAILYLFNIIRNKTLTDCLYYFEIDNGIVFIFSDGVMLSNITFETSKIFLDTLTVDIAINKIESEALFFELIDKFDKYYYHDEVLNVLSRMILLEAKGRIINHKNINEPLGLMKRQTMTQMMLNIPYANELDGIWEFRNISLRDTIDLLPEINPYYIFSYYTLCSLYGFFDDKSTDGKQKKQLDLNALLSELQKL